MGRVKVSMELINDSKKRKITFLRRKEGLIKKARELSTLCDVNVSMIICSDHQEGPEIFPQDHVKLSDVINAYKRKRVSDPRKIKPYSLCDFFKDRKNKIEGELAKAKKSNLEAKYPTSLEFLDNSSEVQLRDFACKLGMKLNQVMPLLKHNPITTMTHFDYNNNDNTSIESSGASITNVDNRFYPIMPMGQNVFGIDQRLMQALNSNSMKSGVINDCYDRPNFDLKREMMHQLEQPQYRNMHQFMSSCLLGQTHHWANPNLLYKKAVTKQLEDSSYLGLRKNYRLSLKNDMPPRDKANPADIFTFASGINGKAQTESNLSNNDLNIKLSKELLLELENNAYHGMFHEDVVDHIAKVLELLDLIKIPSVDSHQLRMKVFPLSLADDARQWWIDEGKEKLPLGKS
ncbi:transcription factor, MADS-box [Tanacetum coccineum]